MPLFTGRFHISRTCSSCHMAADVGYGSGESLDATLLASGSETIQVRSKAEVLAGSVKGGVLTDFKAQADIRTAIEKSNALRYIDQLRIACQNKTEAFDNATIERNEQRTQLRALDKECQDCQEGILALQRAVPIELKRRNQETILKKRFEAARIRVEQQRSVLEASDERHNLLTKEIDEFQLELSRFEAVELDLRAEKAVSVYEQRIKADESLVLRKRTEQRVFLEPLLSLLEPTTAATDTTATGRLVHADNLYRDTS